MVKIVRELDRYGGACAAEWARPDASRLDAPAEEDAAFARAWLCGAEPALQESEADPDRLGPERPENLAQRSETIESAPGNGAVSAASDGPPDAEAAPLILSLSKDSLSLSKDSSTLSNDAPVNAEAPAPTRDERPENPAQAPGNVESAPGNGTGPNGFGRPDPDAAPRASAGAAAAPAGDERPENPAQDLEKVESAPGFRDSAEGPAITPWVSLPPGLRRAA